MLGSQAVFKQYGESRTCNNYLPKFASVVDEVSFLNGSFNRRIYHARHSF